MAIKVKYHDEIYVPSAPSKAWRHGRPYSLTAKVKETSTRDHNTVDLHKNFNPTPLIYTVNSKTHTYSCEWDVIVCEKSETPVLDNGSLIFDIIITYLARSPFKHKPGCLSLTSRIFMRSTGPYWNLPSGRPLVPGSGGGSMGGTNDNTGKKNQITDRLGIPDELIREFEERLATLGEDVSSKKIYSEIRDLFTLYATQQRSRAILNRINSKEYSEQIHPRILELVTIHSNLKPHPPTYGDRDIIKVADFDLDNPR